MTPTSFFPLFSPIYYLLLCSLSLKYCLSKARFLPSFSKASKTFSPTPVKMSTFQVANRCFNCPFAYLAVVMVAAVWYLLQKSPINDIIRIFFQLSSFTTSSQGQETSVHWRHSPRDARAAWLRDTEFTAAVSAIVARTMNCLEHNYDEVTSMWFERRSCGE